MDIKQLSNVIDKNRLLVFSIIKSKKQIPIEVLEDSYSAATLEILQQHEKITIKNLTLELLRLTYKEIGVYYRQKNDTERFLVKDLRHYDKIDYNKLDKRIFNRLTPRQKIIFKYRCLHFTPSQMPVKYSKQNINQISYAILQKYKKFMQTMQEIKKEDIKKLTKSKRKILQLYYKGHTATTISQKLNLTQGYVKTTICIAKQTIKNL